MLKKYSTLVQVWWGTVWYYSEQSFLYTLLGNSGQIYSSTLKRKHLKKLVFNSGQENSSVSHEFLKHEQVWCIRAVGKSNKRSKLWYEVTDAFMFHLAKDIVPSKAVDHLANDTMMHVLDTEYDLPVFLMQYIQLYCQHIAVFSLYPHVMSVSVQCADTPSTMNAWHLADCTGRQLD